jgi:hypothetical protein
MSGRIEHLTIPRLLEVCHGMDIEEEAELLPAAQRSDPLLGGFWDDQLLCVVGFVPATILSDSAYLWMCSTPLVNEHKLIFGRWCKWMAGNALTRFQVVRGHCDRHSVGWLRHLGARLEPPDQFGIPFFFERAR